MTGPGDPGATDPATDLLVVGAHPDDAELGLGGTLALMALAGWRCAILDLTDGEPTPRGSRSVRAAEAARAAEILGVRRRTLDLPNRRLSDSTEAREATASVMREWRPRIVAVPWWEDAHPDHVAACRVAEAARFYSKFTKTDMPGRPFYPPRMVYFVASHLRVVPRPAIVVDITKTIEVKMEAVDAYRSQFGEGGSREAFLASIRSTADMWGRLAGLDATGDPVVGAFGEPLIVREPIALGGLEGLV